MDAFFIVVSLASYTIIAIASFDLFWMSNKFMKKAGVVSIIYSLVAIGFLLIGFMNNDPENILWFIPNIIMALIFLIFLFDMKYCGLDQGKTFQHKVKNIFLPFIFIKFIIFISAITLFLLVSTVAIHEMGHSLTAQYYGCEKSKAVIYDITAPAHTEMMCTGYYNDRIITLAGILLPMATGLIFLITGSSFTTKISLVIFGFSLIISSRDFGILDLSKSTIFLLIVSGYAFLSYGVIRFSVNYVKQKGGLSTKRRILEESEFWIDNTTAVKDLYDLVDKLHEMTNLKFKQVFKTKKNELVKWVRETLNEKTIAQRISKVSNKKEMQVAIMDYLIENEAENDKNIFSYLCYPILQEKIKKVKEKSNNRIKGQS